MRRRPLRHWSSGFCLSATRRSGYWQGRNQPKVKVPVDDHDIRANGADRQDNGHLAVRLFCLLP
jgi:hypothetical protein